MAGLCQGHGQTWEVRCVQCRKLKWPVALERPVGYVCRLCQLGSTRTVAARRRVAAQRQKAVTVAVYPYGGPLASHAQVGP